MVEGRHQKEKGKKMINFCLSLRNPFSNKFKNLFFKVGRLTKNKTWDIEINQTNGIIGVDFSWTFMKDHAGLTLMFVFLSFEIGFQIYDNRHWNHIMNTWDRR